MTVRQRPDFFHDASPYFTEHVRRDIAKRYGEKKLLEGGLRDRDDARAVDRSRGAGERRLLAAQARQAAGLARPRGAPRGRGRRRSSAARVAARYGAEPPAEGRLYLGLVEGVDARRRAKVRVGGERLHAAVADFLWACALQRHATRRTAVCSSRTVGVLRAGDVVWVSERAPLEAAPLLRLDLRREERGAVAAGLRREDDEAAARREAVELTLEQTPRVQGPIFSYDHGTGYVVAMVGGVDFDRSRVQPRRRRPAASRARPTSPSTTRSRSTGATASTSLLNDVPRAEVDPITGEVWTPHEPQQHRRVPGHAGVRADLVEERAVGAALQARGRAKRSRPGRAGSASPTKIIPDQALALGASCARTDELTRAFAAFARNGVLVDPVYVRRVRDRDGASSRTTPSVGDPLRLAVRAPRSPGGDRRRRAGARDLAAHRLAHVDAAPPGRDARARAARSAPPSAGRRQDRHLERDDGHLVRRLHVALDDDDLDRRRPARAAARPQGRGVHADACRCSRAT